MKVSVIIPCFNVRSLIDECIDSVLTQAHQDIEIICVDNNSTDDTLTVLQHLAEQHDRVVVSSESKPGAPAARNHGLKMSDGEWVQFLDADDLLLPLKIASQVELAIQTPSAPFIASAYTRHDVSTGEREDILPNERPWHGLITNRLGITSANLFRREALKEVEGFDEKLKSSQEYDLMFRMMLNMNEPVYALLPFTVIRSRKEGSISSVDVAGNKHRFLNLTARIATYLQKELPKEYDDLGEEWRQSIFIRIYLNAVDGHSDSPSLFEDILPPGFKAYPHPYVATWFRLVTKLVGYKTALRLRGARGGRRQDD